MGVRLPDKLPLRRASSGAPSPDRERDGEGRDGGSGALPRARQAVGTALGDGRVRGLLAAAALIVIIVLIAGSGGQSVTPPATGAASVVPSDALAYVHFSTDDSRSAVTSALALARRFPDYARLRAELIARIDLTNPASALDFNRDIRPWLGKEAAWALLDTGAATPASLVVLGVGNRREAERFLAGLPVHGTQSYQGTTMTGHPGADATALVGHYLLIGHSAAIRAAIDAAAGRSAALSEDPAYRRATKSEPAGRAVDAYVTATGLTRLLASRGGFVGATASLLYQPTLQGIAISLTPASGALQLSMRSVRDPRLASSSAVSFTPSFGSSAPSGAAMFLDVTGLNALLPRILTTTGIGGRIPELLGKLGKALTAEGIDVKGDISTLFRRESAVIISSHASVPVLTVIARTTDPSQTRTVFAQLQQPLERLFAQVGAAAGQAPVFNQVSAGGITAHQLVLAPGLQFDYAVSGHSLVISTSLAGIAAVGRHASSIIDDNAYQQALGNHPASVTSLLFLDLNQLLRLGEQYGLLTGASYSALKPDLERIHVIGMYSTSGEAESTAELFLQIL